MKERTNIEEKIKRKLSYIVIRLRFIVLVIYLKNETDIFIPIDLFAEKKKT
jgi:hypothetical protein